MAKKLLGHSDFRDVPILRWEDGDDMNHPLLSPAQLPDFTPFRAGRPQMKNPATRGRVLIDQFRGRGIIAATDQYFATTGADGAKLNR
jgi:hypothetical protein